MPNFVRVAVNVPQVNGVFDYHLPPELDDLVLVGCLVVVPFGKQLVQGIVIERMKEASVSVTKPVAVLLDTKPVLTPVQMKLATWMEEYYLARAAQTLDLMLPPGLSQLADTSFQFNSAAAPARDLSPLQQRVLTAIHDRGGLRGRQLDTAFPHVNVRTVVQALTRRGLVTSQPVLAPPSVRPKFIRTAQLACSPETVKEEWDSLSKTSSAAQNRRKMVLEFLLQEPEPVNVAWVYASAPGSSLADLQTLEELGLVRLSESEIWRDPLEKITWVPQQAPILTAEQSSVWDQLLTILQKALSGKETPAPILLHGVTGSGKTELYLRAVEEVLRQGKQAIILVPEISLTPQTVRRFLARFPGQVGLVHSKLSPGERYDTWRRVREGRLPVIVGPRSALFSPLSNLGLVVIDECHDDSYYQDDFSPAYDAIETALAFARLSGAVALLGSATPSVNQRYRAETNQWNIFRLPNRILAHKQAVQSQLENFPAPLPNLEEDRDATHLPLPPVQIVDMRQELKAGNRTIFSRALQEALANTLNKGQQAILFLNRRGSATYVFCRECGYTLRCPRCDLPLVYHKDEDALICHTCNYQRKMPATCPQCNSRAIRLFGTGTEKVESAVKELFPQAGVLRWDAETTRQKGMHDILLAHFSNHRADILVGTQMLAKGLDLPLVTLVGVVLADVGLNLPDFRAVERTFQLLTQVTGRAGRSPLGGKAILQSFDPNAPAIQMAASYNYDGFYQTELDLRRKLGYPPFSRLASLEFRASSSAAAEEQAQKMASQIDHWIEESEFQRTEMIGPVPCYYQKQSGQFRWQIILRGSDPTAILRGRPLGDARLLIDPPSLL